MTLQEVLDSMEEKMMKTLEFVHSEFATVRTGKASTSLVENIPVEAYGSHMRLRELAGISTPEPRLIVVQPWDATLVQAVEKAIMKSELGVNPRVDGKIIRIPIPELDQERRRELDKVCKKMAEDGRIAIRNERRHAHDLAKKLQKDGDITEDELKHSRKRNSEQDRRVHQRDRHRPVPQGKGNSRGMNCRRESGTRPMGFGPESFRDRRPSRKVCAENFTVAIRVRFAIVNPLAWQFRRPHRLARSRTSPFHGGNTGSNPVGVAILFLLSKWLVFVLRAGQC